MIKFTTEEFYPTPEELLTEITRGIDWCKIESVLEPSAGKGEIVDFVMKTAEAARWRYYDKRIDVDCIEKDEDLRHILKGKEYRVVHDDFLTFNTFKKYDLIIMNPPFSNGAAHLLRALDIQKNGGAVLCILNAETLRNPYTNERKVLVQKLIELNAEITYKENAFIAAERPTGVEIAIIKVSIPEEQLESAIFDELRKKAYAESSYEEVSELAVNDFIKALVAMYNVEVEAGLKLIQEYRAMCPYMLNDLRESVKYKNPILQLKVGDKDLSTNYYVKRVREKYWNALFRHREFTKHMTSNLSSKYMSEVEKLCEYDFSFYNINCIQLEMSQNLIRGIEDCIVALFDKLSYQYSYSDELSSNIHYYNGWKTNKAWFINKKVILPYMNAFSSWSGRFSPDYNVKGELMDIEKALNYLDGGLTECRDMEMWLRHAEEIGQTKKIQLKYFKVTFYKKGTCHIEFTNEELLKKLNIFGAQNKKWLPPAYGKKKYAEMDKEEQQVIDEFEGKESYEQVLNNTAYYIYDPKSSLPCLEVAS